MDSHEKVILPINLQKEFNNILGYAFPLCILLSEEKYIGWYYENYIQTYAQLQKDYHMRFDVVDVLGYDQYDPRLISNSSVDLCSAKRIDNIEEELCRKLTERFYPVIFLDQFYIENNYFYNKQHYLHEILLYGFDKKKQIFKVIAFDRDRKFSSFDISFKEIRKSFYTSLKEDIVSTHLDIINNRIMYFKLEDFSGYYPFDIKIFEKKLNNYYIGNIEKSDFYLKDYISKEDEKCIYPIVGIQAYLVFIDYFKGLLEVLSISPELFTDYIDAKYTFIHLFAQHKMGMYKRFNYIYQQFLVYDIFKNLVSCYLDIALEIDNIRFKWILLINKMQKAILSGEDITSSQTYAMNRINSFIYQMNLLLQKEKQIVRDILIELAKIDYKKSR